MAEGRNRSAGEMGAAEPFPLAELEAEAGAGDDPEDGEMSPGEAPGSGPVGTAGIQSLLAGGIAYNGNTPAITPERECWLDVLRRARLDLRGKRLYGEDAALARAEWIVWMQSPDFELVCDLAGLPARRVRQLLMAEIPNG